MTLCPFSKHQDIFGKVGEGVHKIRIPGTDTAMVDYVLTLLLAILLTFITKWPLVLTTILMFIIGIILHTLFGVETKAVKTLALSCKK
jgi:hypothetical protein